MLGGAGFLAVGAPLLSLAGHDLSAAELAAGTVVCAGAAMLPDLDHPQATCAQSLGPVTKTLSRITAKLFGGHRNGTHSLLFAFGATALFAFLLHISSGPWVALAICFFFTSLVVRTLTEASGAISAAISALVAATLITIAPEQDWIFLSIGLGCLLHDLGDILTPEGVPPLWPVSKQRVRFPVVGHTGDWREGLIAGLCGLAMCFLLATQVFLPTWKESSSQGYSPPATSFSQPLYKDVPKAEDNSPKWPDLP